MRPSKLLIASAVVAALLSGCGKKDDMRVPLPYAYPRPNLPDTVMTPAAGTPLHFLVNAQAKTDVPRPGWLNVAYPELGATIHVTFTATNPDDVWEVKDNRMERLLLNAGERAVDFSEFTNAAGFYVAAATSEGALTPLQFIASDDSAWVVSGAVYFDSPGAASNPDSIRPVVQAIRRDLLRSLSSIEIPTIAGVVN